MTIGRKFALVGALLVAFTLVVGVISLVELSSIDQAVVTVTDDSLIGVSACTKVESEILTIWAYSWRHVASTDEQDMARIEQEIASIRTQMNDDLKTVEGAIYSEEERQINQKIRPALERAFSGWEKVRALSRAQKNAEAYQAYVRDLSPMFRDLREAIRAESDYNRRGGELHSQRTRQAIQRTRTTLWIIMALAIAGAALLLFSIVTRLNATLRHASSGLRDAGERVAAAATQLAASSSSLAQGASEQAASVEETSASAEEINSMARANTENTNTAASLASGAQEDFRRANTRLDDLVAAMAEVEVSSGKISRIIRVIDEIAFQTNILALNAAVEAARAGDAGMGFAVVADEVRTLAQRCAQAARDTTSLIEESIVKSQDSKSKVDDIAVVIRRLTEESGRIKVLVEETSAASAQQSSGIDQVSTAIAQMQEIAQRTAATAEQTSSVSQELTSQSQQLRRIVGEVSEMVGA